MRAQEQLMALYEEWGALSSAEVDAIHKAAWTRVTECQEAKRALQARIVSIGSRFEAELWAQPAQRAELEAPVRQRIGQLIEQETRNAETLSDIRRQAEREHEGLQRSTRNLRQVQRSYAPVREALWQSYS